MRIGAVNYLNSKPLVYRLAERAPFARVSYDLPSRLALSLNTGRLDVALVPSFEFLSDPSYQLASDACVASRGPVHSVKLYFRRPPKEVKRLALDEGSRTSAALSRVLLQRRYGLRPETCRLPIGCGVESADADAVLLIGDRAMAAPSAPFVESWDLGEEWFRWTGLPFVFACWAARKDVETREVASALAQARDEGVANLSFIASQEAPKLGLTEDFAHRYLSTNLHYTIGPREHEALDQFRQECHRIGLFTNPNLAATTSACSTRSDHQQ